jgi:S-layer protein
MALQGFDESYYLNAKLTALQATETEWAGKTTDFLKTVLQNVYDLTPENHYTQYGYQEGLGPNAYFNAAEYKLAKATALFNSGHYLTVEAAQAAYEAAWTGDDYQHYLQYGSAEGVNPSNDFDESSYLASKLVSLQANAATATEWATKTVADVQAAFTAAGLSALGHYQTFGATEGIAVTAVPTAEQVTVTTTTTTGTTFTLTTGIDVKTGTSGADTFDGSVNANGTATLTSVDVLDGAGGNDSLVAEMTGSTIAPTVKNIEAVEIIGGGAAASTFNMVNVSESPTVLVRNSSQTVTIDSFSGDSVTMRDQAADLTINVTNTSAVGANTFTLNLSGAQSDGTGGSDVALVQMAGADTSGIETVVVDSGGSNANFLDSLTSVNGAATSKIATLDVTGAQALTIATGLNASVKTLDASTTTGGVTASFAATTAVTLTGGTGNDTLTMTANAGDVSVTAGEGNDVVALTGGSFTTADSIDGGAGTADRLDVIAADAEAIVAALTNTTNFEQLSLNTAGTGASSINATYFGTIDTVRLDKGTGAAYGVTMAAGAKTLSIATTNETLAGTLTVTDTGTATTDALTISNRNTTSATNNFNGQAITSAGYETVTVNTGSTATLAQTLGVITITGDATNTAQTINVTGANALTIGAPSSNSSALFSIDASGMTAQAAGTPTFTMAAPTFAGVTGTVSITGSAGQDVLLGHASAANTISGGAGVDTVTGGSAADSLSGGAGNDVITGGGGNDIVSGGDGNDTITMTTGTVTVDGGAGNDTVNVGATLTAGDSLVGGDGTDTLKISTAAVTATVAAGVSGFETLEFDATGAATQDMVQFTANSTFTRLNFGATAGNTNAFSNVAAGVATLGLADVALTGGTMTRLVDTTADTLAITAAGMTAARVVTALSIANEETVSIATGSVAAGDLTITTLTANDIKSLTVTGVGDLTVTNSIGSGASLATINAVAATGTITLLADTSVVDMTITGSLSAGNTITGGTGSDVMTGGDAVDSLTGGNGADNISGGGGADVLLGGLGNDTISGGIGADTITGGVGNDALTGGDGADQFVFAAVGSNGVDTISDFVTTSDTINVTTDITAAAVTITAAAVAQALVDNTEYYISTNGAAANLTTAGTATLNVADMTATTLTNLATYLTERFTEGIAGDVAVFAINWTAGGNTNTYIYDFVEDATGTAVIASELTLAGVVTHTADAILVSGDLI